MSSAIHAAVISSRSRRQRQQQQQQQQQQPSLVSPLLAWPFCVPLVATAMHHTAAHCCTQRMRTRNDQASACPRVGVRALFQDEDAPEPFRFAAFSPALRMKLDRISQNFLSNLFPVRLHCKHLVERLLYEDSLRRGLFRLMNQGAIFVLLIIAQMFAGDPSAKRGIYNNLSERAV